MLEKDGHDVVVVADGREALAVVQERPFDLVLPLILDDVDEFLVSVPPDRRARSSAPNLRSAH